MIKMRQTINVFRVSIISSGLIALLGCGTANVHVKRLGEDAISKRSVYYALPKTRLKINVTHSDTTFWFEKGDTNKNPIPEVCRNLGNKLTPIVKSNELTKVVIERDVIVDPDHVYAIELDAHYFESFDLQLKLSESGLYGLADVTVVNNSDKVALETASTLISSAVPFIRGGDVIAGIQANIDNRNARALMLEKSDASYGMKNFSTCKSRIDEVKKYIDKIEKARRNLFNNPSPELLEAANFTKVSEQYDQENKRALELLKTARSIKSKTDTFYIEPDLSVLEEGCLPISDSKSLKYCAEISEGQKDFIARINEAETMVNKKQNNNSGFRYRVPATTTIKVFSYPDSSKAKKGKLEAELTTLITQFGTVAALPAGLGNRENSQKLELYDLSGALESLTITSVASSPDAVATALSSALTEIVKPKEQKLKENLESELELLKLINDIDEQKEKLEE